MKNIFYLLISLSLVSCYKYAEQTTPTLSGEYIIDKITLTQNESMGNPIDTVYYPGDVLIDSTSLFPLDLVEVGSTRWHFDYMQVAFSPTPTQWGTYEWSEKYFYDLIPGWTIYYYGYVQLKLNGRVLTLKIIEDGIESLTFRTTGQWYNDEDELSSKTLTLQLTRIGP